MATHSVPRRTEKWHINSHSLLILLSLWTAPIMATEVAAQKHTAPGVTDTEIKVGQTMPYSGPASAWGAVGRAEACIPQDDQRSRRH